DGIRDKLVTGVQTCALPISKLRKDLGLDKPYHVQYALWLWQMMSFNPGDSIFTNEPIPVSLKKAIPVTLELAALAMVIGIVIARSEERRVGKEWRSRGRARE